MTTAIVGIALVFVLAFTSSASAECAWVVWSNFASDNPQSPLGGVWTPEASYETRTLCEDDAGRRSVQTGGQRRSGPFRYLATFRCLPDTIDPRGSKASGR